MLKKAVTHILTGLSYFVALLTAYGLAAWTVTLVDISIAYRISDTELWCYVLLLMMLVLPPTIIVSRKRFGTIALICLFLFCFAAGGTLTPGLKHKYGLKVSR